MKQKGVRMANNGVRVGDKFIIEVGSTYYSPTMGNKYFIKGFNSLVFDDNGINKLERYKPAVPHTCENCKYRHYEREMPPCSMCDNNYDIETRDMFEPKNGK